MAQRMRSWEVMFFFLKPVPGPKRIDNCQHKKNPTLEVLNWVAGEKLGILIFFDSLKKTSKEDTPSHLFLFAWREEEDEILSSVKIRCFMSDHYEPIRIILPLDQLSFLRPVDLFWVSNLRLSEGLVFNSILPFATSEWFLRVKASGFFKISPPKHPIYEKDGSYQT